jgi:hypothetical protein
MLTHEDQVRMYEILNKYYEQVTFEVFKDDLFKKNAVIIMRDSVERKIQGFSTILDVRMRVEGQTVIGAFSGDTIIERSYWGKGTLGKAFLAYMLKQKMKNPFKTFHWFLISKGYKTYLLMANNCPTHFPRYDSETPPPMRKIMNAFYQQAYPKYFDSSLGVIRFNGPTCRLKGGVAAIEPELSKKNPKVSFFEKMNPNWHHGDELACVATITFWMPAAYQLKCFWKSLKTSKLSPLYWVQTREVKS